MKSIPRAHSGERKDSDVAILVSSCDRFFDAWRPFAKFWLRFWPGETFPWPAYLVVNRLEVRSHWLTPLPVGQDRGWSDNLRFVLSQIPHEYVLYLQEDYFLTGPVDAARLTGMVDRMRAESVDALCLDAMPPGYGAEDWPRIPDSGGQLSEVPSGSPWRGRLQAAFWRKEALLAALRPGESAWDFEANAQERLRGLRSWTVTGAYAADKAFPYLSSAIVRGLWTPQAVQLCQEHGVKFDPRCRGIFSANRRVCKLRRAFDRIRIPLAVRRQMRRGAVEV